MMTRLMEPFFGENLVDEAIEFAYDRLPEHERATIDTTIERAIRMTPRRGLGEKSFREILGKLGIYLVQHPEISGRFDDDGWLVEFVRAIPTPVHLMTRARRARKLREALRFFGGKSSNEG